MINFFSDLKSKVGPPGLSIHNATSFKIWKAFFQCLEEIHPSSLKKFRFLDIDSSNKDIVDQICRVMGMLHFTQTSKPFFKERKSVELVKIQAWISRQYVADGNLSEFQSSFRLLSWDLARIAADEPTDMQHQHILNIFEVLLVGGDGVPYNMCLELLAFQTGFWWNRHCLSAINAETSSNTTAIALMGQIQNIEAVSTFSSFYFDETPRAGDEVVPLLYKATPTSILSYIVSMCLCDFPSKLGIICKKNGLAGSICNKALRILSKMNNDKTLWSVTNTEERNKHLFLLQLVVISCQGQEGDTNWDQFISFAVDEICKDDE